MDRSELRYWEARASHWRVASPPAPSREDVIWYEARAGENAMSLAGRPLQALLLGVTPAIAAMRWPDSTLLTAVDWSQGMIRHVWPRQSVPAHARAVCADWRQLPIATGSIDLVVGDGCYSVLRLADAALLNREVHRALRPDGLYCQRCFRQPERPISIPQLFDQLFAGRMRNLDLFRWLLAMAVHGTSTDGVDLRHVWQVWYEHVPDPAAMRERFGWADEALANFKFWQENGGRFSFPSQAELRELAEPCFELIASETPRYEMGECFPRLVMRARGPKP